jgi:hypothetical protein
VGGSEYRDHADLYWHTGDILEIYILCDDCDINGVNLHVIYKSRSLRSGRTSRTLRDFAFNGLSGSAAQSSSPLPVKLDDLKRQSAYFFG